MVFFVVIIFFTVLKTGRKLYWIRGITLEVLHSSKVLQLVHRDGEKKIKIIYNKMYFVLYYLYICRH